MTGGPPTTVVVPCFDEAHRLDGDAYVGLADQVGEVLFVDDGSTDGTVAMLRTLATQHPSKVTVLELGRNHGKGEAVRRGMLMALDRDDPPAVVGYLDADLATPPAELVRLRDVLVADDALVGVLGSRVALAGHRITRRRSRHYLGRLYATGASIVLGREIYDTQCGAKVFRAGPPLREALATTFCDRWSFDVELLGRLLRAVPTGLREVPLEEWSEVPGSKIDLGASVRSTASLVRVWWRLRRVPRGPQAEEPAGAT